MGSVNDQPAAGSIHQDERTPFWAVLGFVWGYWRQVPLRLTGMLVGTLLGVLLEVQIPRLSADLVSATEWYLSNPGDSTAAWHAASWLIATFAAVSLVKQLYLRNWMYLASEVMQRMIADGFKKVQRFSLDWHSNHFAGSTQRKVTRGMWAYDTLADTLVIDLGPAFGLLVGFTLAMFLRDPMLGAYFGLSVVIFVGASLLLSLKYVAPANQLSNDADTAIGGALADAITCNAVVKSFGAERREDERFDDTSQQWRRRSRRAWLRSMDAGAVQSVLLLGLLGGLLGLVLFRPDSASGRIENAVYVIATYLVVHSYMRNIGWQVRNAQRGINELDDLVEISKTLPQVDDLPGAPDFQPVAGAIRFENVTFGYRNQPSAIFQGLSVEIKPGEKLALVGESGSGKSTFVKLLQRLYDVDSGRIVIDDQDVCQVTQESLRFAISVVPQEPILFHRSLAENIAYARPNASQAEIVRAARSAHAHEFIERFEQGYRTLVGERGVKLSGGERQRVAIARAILADAPVLVLDSGRVIEEGSHEALMQPPDGHYRRLVEMQAFVAIDESKERAGALQEEFV